MFEHHTKTKGDLAVFKAQLDLFEQGFLILLPQTEHAPFDLVAYQNNQFLRIQVKYRQVTNKGTIEIKFKNSYSTRHGVKMLPVDKSEIDFYCIYCPQTDSCYYINPSNFNQSITIRLFETKNNQQVGVYYAQQFLTIPIQSNKQ